MASVNTRHISCEILFLVLAGKSFSPALIQEYAPTLPEEAKRFCSHLCFGVLRHYFTLKTQLSSLLHHPIKAKDRKVELILLIGLYEILYTDTAEFASVNEAVNASVCINKAWAKKWINAILRQALRSIDALKKIEAAPDEQPAWLINSLKKAWPQHVDAILATHALHPPMTLRVNTHKLSRQEYLSHLQKANIEATLHRIACDAIVLEKPVGVTQLPGFEKGWVSVQDASAQLAVDLLTLQPKLTVLDACAAPGGKTAHMLERFPELQITALDKDKSRLAKVTDTLKRLELSATTLPHDATDTDVFKGKCFDRILIDAPCSATGIIRRHPDIKLHRQSQDISLLVKQQKKLLESLWPLLKPNGILLYATCSILPEENDDQIAAFLKTHPEAVAAPISLPCGLVQRFGVQLLPEQDMDGFYYATLHKTA